MNNVKRYEVWIDDPPGHGATRVVVPSEDYDALARQVASAPHDFWCDKSKMPEAKPGQIFMTSDDIQAHQKTVPCTCWKRNWLPVADGGGQ